MSSGTPPAGSTGLPGRHTRWIGTGLRSTGRGLGFGALSLAGAGLLMALAAPLLLALPLLVTAATVVRRAGGPARAFTVTPGGLPQPDPWKPPLQLLVFTAVLLLAGTVVWLLLLPRILRAVRQLAQLTRWLAGAWCGVRIADPRLPPPPGGGTYVQRLRGVLGDPATGREVLWLAVSAGGGWLLPLLPAGLIMLGLTGLVGPGAHSLATFPPRGFPGDTPSLELLLGVTVAVLGVAAAPWLLAGYGALARAVLAPAGQAELARRVRHLAETRSEAIDTGAAEMRRIERDLHDGAQARLVAMGMTLDAAGQLIDSNPAAARALLLEARDTSARALAELRDLVRGIHPPVLADRGLGDAVRALAMDSPLRARVASDVPGRLPAPVESAAYFAVSELLANVSKHAGATQAWIDIRYSGGMLRVGVSDDGRGGADPSRGTGLRGIERRVAAFDGVLALSSPPGGPTAVTMEIPCALSSPKTFSC
ncbi:MAG TPA: histidine kinase [Streptosporangiaceae bacterium]